MRLFLNISCMTQLNMSRIFKKTLSILLVFSLAIGDVAFCMQPDEHTTLLIRPHPHSPDTLYQSSPLDLAPSPHVSVSIKKAFQEALKSCTPYMLSQLAVTANGIWNGYLYGRLGAATLESEIVTLTYEFFVMGTAMGGLRATSIITGQLNKAKAPPPIINLNEGLGEEEGAIPHKRDDVAIGNVNKASLLLTALYGVLTMPLFTEAGNIVQRIGLVTDPAIIEQIQEYFSGFVVGAPATLLLFNDEQFALGLKDPYAACAFGTFYASVASFFAYPLALGKWGMPALGVRGIGYAMSIGAWTAWLTCRGYFAYGERYKGLDLYTLRFPTFEAFKTYSQFSIPLALTNSVGLVTDALSTQLITGFSKKAASAYSAASTYFQQLDIALLGYSSAISAHMANEDPKKVEDANSGDIKNAKNRICALVATSMGLSVLLAIPALVWQDAFITFFAANLPPHILSLTKRYIWFNAGKSLVNAGANAIEASLHGLKDIGIPVAIDVGTDVLSLLSIRLVAAYTDDPMWLVVAGMADACMGLALYSGRLYHVVKRLTQAVEWVPELETGEGPLMRCWRWVKSWFHNATPLEEVFGQP
jgi:Na+-driven multidrug efflux pump